MIPVRMFRVAAEQDRQLTCWHAFCLSTVAAVGRGTSSVVSFLVAIVAMNRVDVVDLVVDLGDVDLDVHLVKVDLDIDLVDVDLPLEVSHLRIFENLNSAF